MAKPTLFVDTDVETLKSQMDQNYFTSAYMAHAILNAWVKPSADAKTIAPPSKDAEARHLIFTASFVALYPLIGYAPYAPAKAALRNLSDTISTEMNLYAHVAAPVKVHTIFPATIFTPAYETENKIKTELTKVVEGDEGQSPEVVAEGSVARLEAGDEMVTTWFLSRVVWSSIMGGSKRASGLGWLIEGVLGMIAGWIMIFVRWDHDKTIRDWGKKHGTSGAKTT